ncbi:WYL domain-containing protein [Wenzhouxiangella limi]
MLHSQQLEWWLMGFGEKVEVIRPVALRRRLARQFETLYRRYSD